MSGKDDENRLTVPKFSSFKSKVPGASPTTKGHVDEKPSVPKFSSFKSQDSSPTSVNRSSDEKRREHRDDRKRRHHADRDRESGTDSKRRRHESRHEDRDRKRSRSPRRREKHPEPQPPKEKDLKSDIFFFDTKGDRLILKYGGLERSKIPPYRRYGAGRVLGTPGRLVIHREGARDQFSLRMPGEGSALFKDKDGLRVKSLRLRQHPLSLRPRKGREADEEDESFLPLGSSRRKEGTERPESSDDDDQPNYRSIEGKAKVKTMVDSDSSDESGSGDEIPALDQSNPLKWRSIQLSRQVKEHPEDIDAWIELVDHQDRLLRAGESIHHQILESEAHSYAEIKVSMLESALSNTSNPHDRARVLNYLMREGMKVWNSKTASKKWSEFLPDEQDNFVLWIIHLNYSMSNIASFQFDKVKQMLLGRLQETISRASPDSLKSYCEAIYIFLRATRFMHDAGFKELAVAAWQALMELTFFRPQGLEDGQQAIENFQDFWESEVPRFEEAEAGGWSKFVQSPDDAMAPEPLKDSGQAEPSRDSYKAWANVERLQAQKAGFPARTMDEGTEDDPFRVVMFSDIQPLLFWIPESLVPHIRERLVNAFLIFSDLPPFSRPDDWTETAWQDQFLTGSVTCLEIRQAGDENPEDVHRKPPAFSPLKMDSVCTLELLFPGKDWFFYMAPSARFGSAEMDWLQHATGQLVQSAKIGSLALYYLALSFQTELCRIKSLFKGLVRKYPTSTELYNAYALAENARGNTDIAKRVLGTAMDALPGTSDLTRLMLGKTWAWLELEVGSQALAVKRLCSSVDDDLRKVPDDGAEVSTSSVLKAKHVFTNMGIQTGSENDSSHIAEECATLLAYLTESGGSEPTSTAQGNISAAMTCVDAASRDLKLREYGESVAHEGLLQFAARLLYLHASKGPFRRLYIREQLLKFLSYFPRNTVFLSLLEWSDSSLRVVDETRSLLYEKALVPPHDCVSNRLFAIEHEMNRGNPNSTKAAFEQALSSDVCKSSVQVWMSYIRFCHGQKQLRAKARDVFYRALRHCPWSKGVMMEAFGTLIRDMESDELKAVYNTMTSKGMRIHVDMEEYREKRRGEERKRQG